MARLPEQEAPIVIELVVIVALILANGFFAGTEIAVLALRKSRVKELVREGRKNAAYVLELRNQPDRFLATVQIGITVVGATAAAFGGHSLVKRVAPLFARLSPRYAEDVAFVLVVVAISYLSIVVGEIVPKSLALGRAESYAMLVARPVLGLSRLTRPLVRLLTASSNLVLRMLGHHTTPAEARHSAEELQALVDEATKAGTVDPRAGEIVSRALGFPDLTAADAMVPREEVVMLRRHAPPDEVRRVLLENLHTRMPVYEGRVDNIVGYVSVKDLLPFAWEQRLIVLEDVMRPPYFVPESNKAVDVLQDMRKLRTPFAIIVDEQGGMSGILTMEDLLEELVGEIFSENEDSPQSIRQAPDGTAWIAGATPVRDINRQLGLDLPEGGDWTTVAGLCLAYARKIPSTGERIALPSGVVLEIVDASPRRIRAVRVHPVVAQQG